MDPQLRQVVEITNNLENFVPFATFFFTQWPSFPSPGLPSPDGDGWRWLDFPYMEIDGLSPILKGLRLLVRKAFCRLTYKVFDRFPGILILRVYQLPIDSGYAPVIEYYREHFFRFRKPVSWLQKRCLLILENLFTLADFSAEAFTLSTEQDLLSYLTQRKVALIKGTVRGLSVVTDLEKIPPQTLNFHLERMVGGKSFEHEDMVPTESLATRPLLNRLNEIYSNIESPVIDVNQFAQDEDLLRVHDMINNDEIIGFKSLLYNFQKRSVIKMLQRESLQTFKLMPNVIEIKEGPSKGKTYFDITHLLPILDPPLYLPPRGGILAENMGLGKTCICLALICISKFQISEIPGPYRRRKAYHSETTSPVSGKMKSLLDICVDFVTQNSIPWKEYYADFPANITKKLESTIGYFEKVEPRINLRKTRSSLSIESGRTSSKHRKLYLSSTTLIVLPDNLFHQWRVELFKHVEKNFLNTLEIFSLKQSNLLNFSNLNQLLSNDIILISNSVFSKQFELPDSILKSIYWKRLIIDEGHSMNSKTSRAVLLTKDLMYERMWAITGTPTSGLTNLHIENDTQEYSVQKQFDPKQDLMKVGAMVSNFFKIEPWSLNKKLWSESIIKPFEKNEFGIDMQLSRFLAQLIVKHTISDVESDIKLPALHHRPIFLKPSFFDKISINLFISVLATNAVTSERKGVDFMFDPSNKSDLRRLVTNLQKGTFFWTGFSINDVENLLNICVYSLRENQSKYTDEDKQLLQHSIFISKLALSNMRWRSVTTVHEMGYFVSLLPQAIVDNYSLVGYRDGISVYGYPHLISVQKFFYKNRTIKTNKELSERIQQQSAEFWKGYWANIKGATKKGKSKKANRPLSNKEEYKEFELSDVQTISQLPSWVDTFDPVFEESLLQGFKNGKRNSFEKKESISRTPEIKANSKTRNFDYNNVGSNMRTATIVGTMSAKMNYLAMRLLENQMQGMKSIVFYEFENSAYYLTEFLDLLGMNYLMYSPYIKISDRSNNLAQFDRWIPAKNEGEGIALIMDLKLASHGLTIIAATQVFFINPVWNQSVEAQAIKRAHRIGQMKEVFVETLILENTLEEEMYNMRNDTENMDHIELIDHHKIKEFIMQFPFLKMYFDNQLGNEYADLVVPTSITADLDGHMGFSKVNENNDSDVNDDNDDGVELKHPIGKYISASMSRKWTLPLFTKQNLNKLSLSEKQGIKRRFDIIEGLEDDAILLEAEKGASGSEGNGTSVTSILLDKLRSKRKQKVRFKL